MKDKRLLFAVWVVLAATAASAAVKTEKNVAYAALEQTPPKP